MTGSSRQLSSCLPTDRAMDSIIIQGLEVFAYHGVLPEEKQNGQLFYLDIVLGLPLEKAAASDALSDTVNYDQVCRIAYDTMTARCYDLIERAAGAVIDALLEAFPPVQTVDITLRKPSAPLCRRVEYAAVRLHRERGGVI